MVAVSLVVVAELNEPQAAEPHVTVHCTRGFAVTSLVIAATREVVVLTSSDAGGGTGKVTAIGMGGTIVMTAEAALVGVAMEVAVTVTVEPEGMVAGAV